MLYIIFEVVGLIALVWCTYRVANAANIQDYCLTTNAEQFKAKCLNSEIILMKHAKYGRMRFGHCLEDEGKEILDAFGNNPRFLGCEADILSLLDRKCSGRNECEVRGSDEDLQSIKPCLAGFKLYLEASYDCGSVVDGGRSCEVKVTSTSQYITPMMTSSNFKLSCGSAQNPWKLNAPVGQQITVTFIQFGDGADNLRCKSRGCIIDKPVHKNITLCVESGQRMALVLNSHSNILELVLSDIGLQKTESFLIEFSAIGCSNVLPPVDAWLRRNGSTAVVGCYTSRQSWTLRCVDNQWIGVIGNCTRDNAIHSEYQGPSIPATKKSNPALAEVVIITTIVVIGLLVCTGIVCVGVVCWKRYNLQYKKCSAYQKHFKGEEAYHGHLIKPSTLSLST